jgi:hypothetical protein
MRDLEKMNPPVPDPDIPQAGREARKPEQKD